MCIVELAFNFKLMQVTLLNNEKEYYIRIYYYGLTRHKINYKEI